MNYKWNFNRINDYLTFLDTECERVSRKSITQGGLFAYMYQWLDYESPKSERDEWCYLPLCLIGQKYEIEGIPSFYGLNMFHLPVMVRIPLVNGKSSINDELLKTCLRRYRYSGLVQSVWWIPDTVKNISVLFHPNVYQAASYNSRFGKAPNNSQITKKYSKYYYTDEVNQIQQFK